MQNVVANLPASVRATGLPLKSLTAHCTPSTPRTRLRSVFLSALVCSKYSVSRSMTQMAASVTSRIWLPVRRRIPAKIEVWFSRRKVEKAISEDEREVLGPVAGQHFERDEIHILKQINDSESVNG